MMKNKRMGKNPLLVIGPKRLPDVAKSIGKGYGEFKRSFSDLKQAVNLDETVKPTNEGGSSQSKEEWREELISTYKSQWEQKLPSTQTSISEDKNGSQNIDSATENKDIGDNSGK